MDKYVYYRNSIFLIVLFGVVIITYNLTIGEINDKKIIENHLLACGHIVRMRAGKGVNVIYEFFVNGKRFEENVSSPVGTYNSYKNGNSKILIVFQKDDPENNRILSGDDDFARFRISKQDTVNIHCN